MCGEAVFDRSHLKAGEVRVVICWCGRSNLVTALPFEGRTVRPLEKAAPQARS